MASLFGRGFDSLQLHEWNKRTAVNRRFFFYKRLPLLQLYMKSFTNIQLQNINTDLF